MKGQSRIAANVKNFVWQKDFVGWHGKRNVGVFQDAQNVRKSASKTQKEKKIIRQ